MDIAKHQLHVAQLNAPTYAQGFSTSVPFLSQSPPQNGLAYFASQSAMSATSQHVNISPLPYGHPVRPATFPHLQLVPQQLTAQVSNGVAQTGIQPTAILASVNYKKQRLKRRKPDADNTANELATPEVSSRYHGVTWYKSSSRWQARLCAGRKQIHLGYFKVEEDAARAYDMAVIQHANPRVTRLNFPEEAARYTAHIAQQPQLVMSTEATGTALTVAHGMSPVLLNTQPLPTTPPSQLPPISHPIANGTAGCSTIPVLRGPAPQTSLVQATAPNRRLELQPPSLQMRQSQQQQSCDSEQRRLSPHVVRQDSPFVGPDSSMPPADAGANVAKLTAAGPATHLASSSNLQAEGAGITSRRHLLGTTSPLKPGVTSSSLSALQGSAEKVEGPQHSGIAPLPLPSTGGGGLEPQSSLPGPGSIAARAQSATTSAPQSDTQCTPLMPAQELMSRAGKSGIPGVLLPDTGEFIPTGAMGTLQIYERVGDGSQIMLRSVIVGVVPDQPTAAAAPP